MSPEIARVFVSYDRANDADLRDRLVAESRRSAVFSVEASSEASASDDARLRNQISAADAVIVICGEHTDSCVSVSDELRVCRELDTPLLLLWGRRAAMCKKPASARPDDAIYGWTPEILRVQLQTLTRTKREVPVRLRRAAAPAKSEG